MQRTKELDMLAYLQYANKNFRKYKPWYLYKMLVQNMLRTYYVK